MAASAADIKALREKTGAAIMDCKKALEEANNDMAKAEALVVARGLAKAEKKADRETKEGYIASYVHTNGKVAALVELLCETDFVARNEEFIKMSQAVAMQVVAMNPENVTELLEQEYLRDPSITIEQLVKQLSGKIGEHFVINRFVRFAVSETASE